MSVGVAITAGVAGAAVGVGLTIKVGVGSCIAVGRGAEALAEVGVAVACDSLGGVGSVVDVAFAGVRARDAEARDRVAGTCVALATAVAGGVARGRSVGC